MNDTIGIHQSKESNNAARVLYYRLIQRVISLYQIVRMDRKKAELLRQAISELMANADISLDRRQAVRLEIEAALARGARETFEHRGANDALSMPKRLENEREVDTGAIKVVLGRATQPVAAPSGPETEALLSGVQQEITKSTDSIVQGGNEEWLSERPKWRDRAKYPVLAKLTSPEFLRAVFKDKIVDGVVHKEVIRKCDSALMAAVEVYLSTRKSRSLSLGEADGLKFIASQPTRNAIPREETFAKRYGGDAPVVIEAFREADRAHGAARRLQRHKP